MKCLLCKKTIPSLYTGTDTPDNAGIIRVCFGYGSRYDQIGMRTGTAPTSNNPTRDQLLTSDQIQAYICDDCFDANLDCFEGYRVVKSASDRKKIVG